MSKFTLEIELEIGDTEDKALLRLFKYIGKVKPNKRLRLKLLELEKENKKEKHREIPYIEFVEETEGVQTC